MSTTITVPTLHQALGALGLTSQPSTTGLDPGPVLALLAALVCTAWLSWALTRRAMLRALADLVEQARAERARAHRVAHREPSRSAHDAHQEAVARHAALEDAVKRL